MAFAIWRRQLREGPAARLPTRHQDLLAKPAPSQHPHCTGLAARVGAQCHRLSMRGQLCLTPVMITPRCDPGMKQMMGTWRWPG